MRLAQRMGWEFQEPGWYTRDGVGGICREADGKWWFYPATPSAVSEPLRAYSTLANAVKAESPESP